jgi:hypothetical protein
MGRTVKDSGRLRTMPNVYEIIRRQDLSFDIFHNDELADSSVPDGWLEDQMARYGICGKEYHDMRRDLDELGKVRLVYAERKKSAPKITHH